MRGAARLALAVAAGLASASAAQADLAFMDDRCLEPFFGGASSLPTAGLEAIEHGGAQFYRGSRSDQLLSGDLGNDWLRACNVAWSPGGEADVIVRRWRELMLAYGLDAPEGCVRAGNGERQFYAVSQTSNAAGLYPFGQLILSDDGRRAWTQMSETDAPYPIQFECPDAL